MAAKGNCTTDAVGQEKLCKGSSCMAAKGNCTTDAVGKEIPFHQPQSTPKRKHPHGKRFKPNRMKSMEESKKNQCPEILTTQKGRFSSPIRTDL